MGLLRSNLLTEARFEHAFATRSTADLEILLALNASSIVQVKQVHGARAVEADRARGGPTEADAVIARSREGPCAVGIRVADCVPILVGDAATGDVAAVHAGWRGVVEGVVHAAVHALLGHSAASGGHLIAAIGPCIGPCCFEVGPDVAERIARACEGVPVVIREGYARAHVDLRAAVRGQLRAIGIGNERIDDVNGCTKHDAERFDSYRRDGDRSGRMLAAIASRNEEGRPLRTTRGWLK